MTICIAALCDSGKTIVAASDHMLSASFLALEFEHPRSKIELLSNSCVGLTAGDAIAHTALFRACRDKIKTLQAPSVEMIAEHVKDLFGDLRRKRAEDALLKPRGLALDSFYNDGLIKNLPPELSMGLDNGIQNAFFPLSIIIAGVDESGAHIYGIEDPGIADCYDNLYYHAIGTGRNHALLNIIGNEHTVEKGATETIFTVYEAKRHSELAQGVGANTEMCMITADGIQNLSYNQKEFLDRIYTKKMEPRLDEVNGLIAGFPWKEGE